MPDRKIAKPSRAAFAVVAVCFFLSGAAGILFETVWARAFGLVLGNSFQGISVVVGLFLGGLGVGAALAARFVRRIPHPVVAYAWVEACIGLWGLLGILLLPRMPAIVASVVHTNDPASPVLFLVRTAAALLFLAPPTLLMGMTLPLLSEGLARGSRFLSSLALLYGINTVGAFAGAILAGFILLPRIGAAWTTAVASGFNFTILFLAVVLRAAAGAETGEASQATAPPRDSQGEGTGVGACGPLPSRLLGPLFLATGALALVSEIAWTRALSLVLGSSTYTFSLILAVFLLGGGAGSLIWRTVRREPKEPMRLYGILWVAFGLALLLSIVVLDHSASLFLRLYALTCTRRAFVLGGLFLLASSVILPPSILLGLHFPLTGALFHARGGSPGRAAGRAYLWNCLGALAGSLATGFLLLSALGTAGTLRAVAAVSLLVGGGLVILTVSPKVEIRLASFVCLMSLALGVGVLGPGLDQLLCEQGIYRYVSPQIARALPLQDFMAKARSFENRRRLFLEEGRLSTVAVWYGGMNLALTVGGKADASISDMETQVLLGQLPMLFHPAPKDVFIVGYGSGLTAEAVLRHAPRLVQIAEIEPSVIRAAEFFKPWTPTLNAGGSQVLLEDGRAALTFGKRSYDVIISEPSNPWISGVNALFTEEFYRIARSRLNAGGIFCQWVQVYEMSPETQGAMFRSLRSVFPDLLVFEAGVDTICIAGRDGPPRLDPRLWESKRTVPVRASLESIGIYTLADLLTRVMNDQSLVAAAGTRNTDDNGLVEYRAPWELPAFLPTQLSVRPEDLRARDPLALWRSIAGEGVSEGTVEEGVGSALLRGQPALARGLLEGWSRGGGLRSRFPGAAGGIPGGGFRKGRPVGHPAAGGGHRRHGGWAHEPAPVRGCPLLALQRRGTRSPEWAGFHPAGRVPRIPWPDSRPARALGEGPTAGPLDRAVRGALPDGGGQNLPGGRRGGRGRPAAGHRRGSLPGTGLHPPGRDPCEVGQIRRGAGGRLDGGGVPSGERGAPEPRTPGGRVIRTATGFLWEGLPSPHGGGAR